MHRLVDRARHLTREAALVPVLAVLALVGFLPRRVPDLRRLVASREFASRHGAVVSWVDTQFGLIEAAAPWLRPIGRRVADSCTTKWERQPFSLARDPAEVVCTRTVLAAYGCDGDLRSLLTELSSTLFAIGWGYLEDDNRTVRPGRLGPSAWPKRSLSWRPPAGQPDALWESADMDVSWADRTDPGNILAPRNQGDVDPARASLLYQPVEIGGDDLDALAARALLRHEDTIMIEVRAGYYQNASARRIRLARGYLP